MTKIKKMTKILFNRLRLIVNCKSLIVQKGFTLIEILVAVFGFIILMAGLVALFSGIFRTSSQQSLLLSDADYARKLAFQIASEIRNAQTGANGAYVLDTADDQQIIYYTPNVDSDSSIERVRYYVQNGQLYKGVTEYNGSTYNTSTESSSIVQKDLANGGTPLFYYYDGSYTGSSTQVSLSQPVNVTLVKMVKLNLQIYNKAGVKNTNTYTITASAAIRNLKTNLGQ